MITISLADVTRRFAFVEEAVSFIREMAKVERARHVDHRDAKLALGAALNQIRGQVTHGEWTDFLRELGVHQRTARAAMQLAERFCDPSGKLMPNRVLEAIHAARERGRCEYEVIRPENANFHQLRQLATTPRPAPKTGMRSPIPADTYPHGTRNWNAQSVSAMAVGGMDDSSVETGMRDAGRTPSTLKPAPTAPTNDLTDFLDDNDDLPAPTAEDLAALAPYAAPHASPHASQQMAATPRPADDDTFRPEEYRPGAPASTATATLRLAGVPVDALGHAPVKPGALVKVGTQLGLGELYELAADTARRQDRLLARADTRDAAAAALREYHDHLERLEGGL